MREVWMGSPHYSTSRGAYLKGAFHTTEGAQKIRDLGAWFQNPAAQCSSHHGSDNYERGLFGAYVYENYSAWTQGNMNGVCLSLEQCTPSGASSNWSRDTWMTKTILLDNAAEWMHYIAEKYGIPYKSLLGSEAQDTWTKGFTEHVEFGSKGSGHHDCGQFPMDVVLDKARAWGGSGGGSTPSTREVIVAGVAFDGSGRPWEVGSWKDNGQINIKIGDVPFAAIDTTQTGGKAPGIGYDPANDRMRVVFINSSGKMAAYTTNVSPVDWAWDELGGSFQG